MNSFEVKKDCFAYCRETNGCRALNDLYCAYEKCRFYKNKEQYKEEMEKSKDYCP